MAVHQSAKYIALLALTALGIGIISLVQGRAEKAAADPPPRTPEEALARIEVPELPAKPAEEKPSGPPLADTWNIAKVKRGSVVKGLDSIKSGILIDATKGEILWAKNENQRLEIASMTKMMTTLLAMEAVSRGEARLDGEVPVSVACSKVGGSQVYLDPRERFPLEVLLKCVMIMSANDAAFAVAESLGGDVGSFVELMNRRASQLGMKTTHYFNPHGLPKKGENNTSCALDQAVLARELLRFPKVLEWTSTRLDSIRDGKFQLSNRNGLVGHCQGVDGLKTGFYAQAGFCTTVTCARNNTRMIAVVIGAPSKKERDAAVRNLLDWGYRQGK